MSDGAQADQEGGAPSSMIVQFATLEGENKGPQIDVPLSSTVLQMEELMNQLLENKDKVRERVLDESLLRKMFAPQETAGSDKKRAVREQIDTPCVGAVFWLLEIHAASRLRLKSTPPD